MQETFRNWFLNHACSLAPSSMKIRKFPRSIHISGGLTILLSLLCAPMAISQERTSPPMRTDFLPSVRSDAIVDQEIRTTTAGEGVLRTHVTPLSRPTLRSSRAENAPSSTSQNTESVGLRPESSAIVAEGEAAGSGFFERLPFRGSVSLKQGYDDNPQSRQVDKFGSWFTGLGGTLSYVFDDPRTQVGLDLTGNINYYYNRPGEDFIGDIAGRIFGSHKMTPRLTLNASSRFTYQQDPSQDIPGISSQNIGNYYYSSNSFSAQYQWSERFSTVTGYDLNALVYENKASADANNRLEHFFNQSFRYLYKPNTTLVADYRYNYQMYLNINRDSMSNIFLLGVDHSFSPRFSASVRGGVEHREYLDARGGSSVSPYVEQSLNYEYAAFSRIFWRNRYSLEAPDSLNQQSREVYRTGLDVRHGLTARLTLTASVGFEYIWNDDNIGVAPFDEQSINLSTGISYAINRAWSANINYTYDQFFSEIKVREYERNRFNIGVSYNY